jgi:hypothetical protein
MNNLQDVREAHQMWERKFENAGREGIVLDCGKSRSLISLLGRIFRKKPSRSATSDDRLVKDYQPV